MTVYPADLAARFGPDDLPGQYALSRDVTLLPSGWPRQELAGWTLAVHERLPVIPLAGAEGRPLGFLLGFPVSDAGKLLRPGEPAPRLPDAADPRPWLDTLSGSWLALLLDVAQPRAYTDPAASVSVVFSPADGLAARSEMLVPYSAATPDRRELIAQMRVPALNNHYPNGMTPREGVERVLPGHYLDLTRWEARRWWPEGPPEAVTDPQTAVSEIAAHLKRSMRALAAHYPLQLSLTAGRDSRSLLACARDLLDRSSLFTTELPADLTRRDVYWSKRMARDLGLPYEVIPYSPAPQRLLDLWLYRTGLAAGNYLSYLGIGVAQSLNPDAAYLQARFSGLARDVWTESILAFDAEWDGRTLTPELLLYLGHIPVTPETRSRMQDWLDKLPLSDPGDILNIFQMEHTVGARSAVLALAFNDTHAAEIWPYNQRRVVELMNGLPRTYKHSRAFYVDILRQEWPELARYPFNEDTRRLIWEGKARRTWGRLVG